MLKETAAGPSLAAAARGWSWAGGGEEESCSDWGAGVFSGSDILRGVGGIGEAGRV